MSDNQFDFDQIDFVTSDTHFSHARIIELAGRPFASVEQMDEELVRRWNDAVGPDDVVLHLGDLALGGLANSLPLTAQLNGRKLLVPGNHDRMTSAQHSSPAYIQRAVELYESFGWTVLPEIIQGSRGGRELLASHYPYRGDSRSGVERHMRVRPVDEGLPLVHGHIHAHDRGADGRQFHVGVDAWGYAPVSMSVIDEWLTAL